MNPERSWTCVLLLPACLTLIGACSESTSPQHSEPMKVGEPLNTSEAVEAAIEAELAPGAPASEIEAFFQRHEIGFAWHSLYNRYEALIRDVEPFHDIRVFVHVDEDRRFMSAQVYDSYTVP